MELTKDTLGSLCASLPSNPDPGREAAPDRGAANPVFRETPPMPVTANPAFFAAAVTFLGPLLAGTGGY